MTRVDKSPEQLDAEASQPLEERNLDSAIFLHRLMFRHDAGLPLKLHYRSGGGGLTTAAWKDNADADPAERSSLLGAIGWTGMAFNPQFEQYLDGTLRYTDSWNSALIWMRERVCRRTHSKHWQPPEWGGALCYRLTSHVIRWEMSLEEAMAKLGLTDEALTKRTLDSALLTVENRLEWMLSGDPPEVRRSPAEWMAPALEHKPLDGLHRSECPVCRKASAA